MNIFREIFLRPIFNLLIIIYNALPRPDLGIAVIILVIVMRTLLWPIFQKSTKSQITFSKLQPEVERIQKKYKEDKGEQTKQLLQLYREHKFNPLSGFFVILIQLPIIVALYRVFLQSTKSNFASLLYAGVANPGALNPNFVHLVDLTKPFFPLVIAAALAQFFQARSLPQPKSKNPNSFQAMFSKQMIFMGPVLTVVVFSKFPSVVALYWCLTSLISIGQQYLIERQVKDLRTSA